GAVSIGIVAGEDTGTIGPTSALSDGKMTCWAPGSNTPPEFWSTVCADAVNVINKMATLISRISCFCASAVAATFRQASIKPRFLPHLTLFTSFSEIASRHKSLFLALGRASTTTFLRLRSPLHFLQ